MGSVDLRTSGGGSLARLGRDLQRAGATELRRELIQGIQRATRDVKREIAESAMSTLPSSGGLAEWVAQLGTVTQVRTSGRHVGVRITGTMDKSRTRKHRRATSTTRRGRRASKGTLFGRGAADLASIERGRVRHPTYGHRPWVLQSVTPGFFSTPLSGPIADQARQECIKAIDAIEKRIGS